MTDELDLEATQASEQHPRAVDSKRRTGLWIGLSVATLALVAAAVAIPVSIANRQAAEQEAASR